MCISNKDYRVFKMYYYNLRFYEHVDYNKFKNVTREIIEN